MAPLSAFKRLRSTYWFLPSVVTITAAALGVALTWLDRLLPDDTSWLGWAYGGGADGARALLSAVAGSTITVVSVTFSVLVVALTVSSQHFGPRLLSSFMRDPIAQVVLGTFTGTFAYCLVVLRTVQGDGGDRYAVFVPHLAVTGAVVLTLVSVAMLIYYVHHVAMSMQVSEITRRVVHDFENTVDRLYPERFGHGAPAPVRPAPAVPAEAFAVRSPRSGYIQEIDSDAVLALAREHDTTVWLAASPGDFMIEERPLAFAHHTPADARAFARELGGAYVFGDDRTPFQDVGFACQQLVEVALRALSPGVNEPFTAMTAIDRLGQGFSKLASRELPSPVRCDEDGRVRVIACTRTLADLLEEAVEPIALHTDGNPAVAERLLAMLAALAEIACRTEDREAIGRLADIVWESAGEKIQGPPRTRLAAAHARLRTIMEASADRPESTARQTG
jgi:uncharacterized membrane protein